MGNERFIEDTYEQALLGLFQSLEGKLAYLRTPFFQNSCLVKLKYKRI